MSDGKDWERVGLRVHPDQLSRWEAVCTPQDPNKPDDELVNQLPHLYDTKSTLIREAVSELINRETGQYEGGSDVDAGTEVVEEKVELVRDDTREVLNRLREISQRQEEIYTEQVQTADDIATEVYEQLPKINASPEDMREAIREQFLSQVDRDWDLIKEEGREYGHMLDLIAYFNQYSAGTVVDSLEKLRVDVDEVHRAVVDGKVFYAVVSDE
jgi:hypothetical protein